MYGQKDDESSSKIDDRPTFLSNIFLSSPRNLFRKLCTFCLAEYNIKMYSYKFYWDAYEYCSHHYLEPVSEPLTVKTSKVMSSQKSFVGA